MSDATIGFYSNPRLVPDDVRIKLGGGGDAHLVWSTADADNHSFVLALGDANQALHVTDVGALAIDWNVAADTHPTLYVHSNTTPATDYLKIGGHDGTNATIDLVGGTTLKIAFDGSAEVDISATALSPSSDGGNALGTTSLGWNGLHLNTGTAIDWESGDVSLTHAANTLTLGGGDLLIDSGFGIAIGHTALLDHGLGGLVPEFEVLGASNSSAAVGLTHWANDTGAARFLIGHSRGAIGTYTTVQDGDKLGEIIFLGADGTDLEESASITGYVDGSPSDGTDMPGRLVFATSADGSASPTERLRIDSTGLSSFKDGGTVVVGHTAAIAGRIVTGGVQALGTDASDAGLLAARFAASVAGPGLEFVKSRNGTLGGNTVVQDGDALGNIIFSGADGTDFASRGAQIAAEVDGTPGTGDMPGRLIFLTTADGAENPTERLRITSGTVITATADINPGADSTYDLGIQTTAQWANVWSDLVNGADISIANRWRMVESELYEGYPVGWAVGHSEEWQDGVSLYKHPETMGDAKPTFVVTDEFMEFRGRRFTPETMDRLLALAEAA